jgi:hypothetical protein
MFRSFLEQEDELRLLIGTEEASRFWAELAKNPSWGLYYLESFVTLLARFMVMSDSASVITSIAAHEFPADHFASELTAHLDSVEAPDDARLIPMFFALVGNAEAITRFSCTMNDLLVQAQRGDMVALARAASIDVGVLALPACQFPMKALQFTHQHDELAHFLNAVAQGPHQGRAPYRELRWIEYLLYEQGAFGACTQSEIYELVVDGLRIYGTDSDHKDSKKALFALFRKWRTNWRTKRAVSVGRSVIG